MNSPSDRAGFSGKLLSVFRRVPPELGAIATSDLAAELLSRLREGGEQIADKGSLADLFASLDLLLEQAADIPENRYSRRMLRDHFCNTSRVLRERHGGCLRGMTVLELGSGSVNPLGVVFMFLIAGARRGIAVDLDVPQDLPLSCRALARCGAYAVAAPSLLFDYCSLSPDAIRDNLRGIDLEKLWHGDSSGLGDRAEYRQESADKLSLGTGSVDFCTTTSFFEHVADVDAAIAEIARVTRTGGLGSHSIDGADHRSYNDPRIGPLDFLSIDTTAFIVHECNRVRPLEFPNIFERHGFSVEHVEPHIRHEVSAQARDAMVEPWSAMSVKMLEVLSLTLYVRKL